MKQIVKKLLLSLRAMAQHNNGAIRNDSLLRQGPAPLDYLMLTVPMISAKQIVGHSVSK